ncbi:MAG: DUF2207 domain-containing protein [Lewinellaceae bacterium]|nr:DUF2207 domain-containing protein [Lewinellaceae bacterium]
MRAEYFTITNYRVAVVITDEGYADFTETIEVLFSEPRHGIFRQIPLKSEVNGKTVVRILRDIKVQGFQFSTSKEGNNLVLKIGDPDIYVDGRQVYHITYRVLNPLNFFEEHSEFYWDLMGNSWPVVTEAFAFEVSLPDRISLNNADVRCFSGPRGPSEQGAELQVFSNRISGRAIQKLMPEEGVTLAIRLPGAAFQPMSDWEYLREQHGLLLAPILFLLSGLLAVFMARNRRVPIMTEYFPPKGISPVVAGGFVDHSVDNNDVLSLIPHLANKGYLKLEMEEGSGFFSKDKITFFKLKEAGDDLMVFEKQFFDALFATGDRVELADLKDKFYVHLSAVRTNVKSWIQGQGWYEPDQKTLGCVVSIAALVALVWGGYAVFGQENLDGIALIVVGIAMFVMATQFNKRTVSGNTTYQQLEGFRQFVKKAERPVIERLLQEDPMYYDKTMPFALAFGYLARWNKQFSGLLSQPPSWYHGRGYAGSNFNDGWSSFAESFPNEVDNIGSVFNSAPSSSSSGGGGGGSSGGGSGGGGGGSW